MPTEFILPEKIVGFAVHAATGNEKAMIQYGELVPPSDPTRVQQVLEGLQGSVFSRARTFLVGYPHADTFVTSWETRSELEFPAPPASTCNVVRWCPACSTPSPR